MERKGQLYLLLLIAVSRLSLVQTATISFGVLNNEAHKNFINNAKAGDFSTPPFCYTMKSNGTYMCRKAEKSAFNATQYLNMVLNQSNSIMKVSILLVNVYKLVYVSERDKELKLSMLVEKTWHDCRVEWNSEQEDYFEIKPREFNKLDVYQPQLKTPEALAPMFPDAGIVYTMIACSGQVVVHYEFPTVLACEIDVRMYPFDIHLCTLTFASDYQDLYMELKNTTRAFNSDELFSEYIPSDVWAMNILPPRCAHACPPTKVKCKCHKHQYRIILRRQPFYQIINLLLPASFIVLISSCVFLVPPNTSDKMGLSLAILLSLYMFCQLMYDKMPETGSTLPLLSQYFLVCIGLVTASCVYSAVSNVISVAHAAVPASLRRLVVTMGPFLMPDMLERQQHTMDQSVRSKSRRLKKPAKRRTSNGLQRLSSHFKGDRTAKEDFESRAEPTAAYGRSADEQHGGCRVFRIHLPETLCWAAFGALMDRSFFISHLLCGLIVLAVFFSKGYNSWSGYATIRDKLSDSDLQHMCKQLAMQGAKFDDLPCDSNVQRTSLDAYVRAHWFN